MYLILHDYKSECQSKFMFYLSDVYNSLSPLHASFPFPPQVNWHISDASSQGLVQQDQYFLHLRWNESKIISTSKTITYNHIYILTIPIWSVLDRPRFRLISNIGKGSWSIHLDNTRQEDELQHRGEVDADNQVQQGLHEP